MPRTLFEKHLCLRLPVIRLVLALLFSGAFAMPGQAAPSCNLESWLITLNTSANRYVASLGTENEPGAARQFRSEMERYTRKQLLNQIQIAELGANETALMDFISARHHLLELQKDNWPEMAARYGRDPRFNAQSASLMSYFSGIECDPNAEDFLNGSEAEKLTLADRFGKGIREIADIVTASSDSEEAAPKPVDPNNFDEFRASLSEQRANQPTEPVVELSASGNAAFVLGLFTFFSAISAWAWMRYGLIQRRATRYPCILPVQVFDGLQTTPGIMLDISQVGAKIEIDLELHLRQKIKLSCGQITQKSKIIWQNNHFTGVRFDRPLSEAELQDLLDHYAQKIEHAREEERQFGLKVGAGFASSQRADLRETLADAPETAASDGFAETTPDQTAPQGASAQTDMPNPQQDRSPPDAA